MKKYITIAALLAAGSAFANAATETFMDLSADKTSGDVTFSAENSSFTGDGIWAVGGGDRAHTGVSFVLNLTKALEVTENTVLINFDMAADIGLYLTSSGVVSKWQDSTWNTSSSYSVLSNLESAWTATDGNTYLALTITLANTEGTQGGTQLYSADSASSLLINTQGETKNGLGSSSNTSISEITVNTDYVVAAAVTPGWVPGNNAQTLSASLMSGAQKIYIPIPEPSTFGLLAGLGALALVGTRRRRK